MEKKQKFVSPKIAWAKNRQSKLKKIDTDYNFNSKFSAVLADAKINSLQSLEDRLPPNNKGICPSVSVAAVPF